MDKPKYSCNENCPSFHFSDIECIGWCEYASDWSRKEICIVEYDPEVKDPRCDD